MSSDNPLNDPPWMNWGRFVGACAAAIIGVVGLCGLVPGIMSDIGSRSWPEVPMTVTLVVKEKGTSTPPHYKVFVDYKFTVEGQPYEQKRHLATSGIALVEDVDIVMRQYAVGTQHPVYYNPRSPGTNPQIERGGNIGSHLIGLVVCLILAVVGPLAGWRCWQVIVLQASGGGRPKKKKRKSQRFE